MTDKTIIPAHHKSVDTEDMFERVVWPYNGYAPGAYWCMCKTCGFSFVGAKRSASCFACAIGDMRKKVDLTTQELKAAAMKEPNETIVAAAIYHGGIFSAPKPARHHVILATLSASLGVDAMSIPPVNQGFLTSTGRFVNRVEAKQIAYRANQPFTQDHRPKQPELFSEDLW